MADPQFDSFQSSFSRQSQFIDIPRSVYKLTHDLSLEEISSYIEVDDDDNNRIIRSELHSGNDVITNGLDLNVSGKHDSVDIVNNIEELSSFDHNSVKNVPTSLSNGLVKRKNELNQNYTQSNGIINGCQCNDIYDICNNDSHDKYILEKNQKNNSQQCRVPGCWPVRNNEPHAAKRPLSPLSTSSEDGLELSPKISHERKSSRKPPRLPLEEQLSLADELQMAGAAMWSPTGKTLKLSTLNQVEYKPYLYTDNRLLCETSSPEEKPCWMNRRRSHHRTSQSSTPSPMTEKPDPSVGLSRSSTGSTLSSGGQELKATHRGLYHFIPRHRDELEIEIGDLLHTEKEDEDLWCTGVNLRTGKRGIFPFAYAVDLEYSLDPDVPKPHCDKFLLRFLGSVAVACHKGNQVLCQAIVKIAQTRKTAADAPSPRYCILEISPHGIKMLDHHGGNAEPVEGATAAERLKNRLEKMFGKRGSVQKSLHNNSHFFSLKNVSFCGYHPRNHRYFGFITKHLTEQQFACHVFLGDKSTQPVAEAVGASFKLFYQEYREYMATSHPTEDIYMD